MNIKHQIVLTISIILGASPAFSQARNVILFIGDGVGVSSLNAASIYGYGKPQALYIQSMPHLALADTSTTREWVADGPASSTAWATGVKTHNGIVSESDSAERFGGKPGQYLKTIVEYAEEQGLSTGLIGDRNETGIADPVIAAAYAHINRGPKPISGEIFLQLLDMKYGNGPDVVIGTGRGLISKQVKNKGLDLAAEIHKRGYTYVESTAALTKLDAANGRVIALLDDADFDVSTAVHQAAARLSGNPKGSLLIVQVDCHFADKQKDLEQIVAYDKVIREVTEERKKDTLVMFAGNFSFDLHVTGENLEETSKSSDSREILDAIYLEKQHTAEEAPVMAIGPGSDSLKGYIPNTEVFQLMMAGLGLK
jgi:alkaline phosphatase